MIMTAEEIRNIYGVAADAIIKSRSEMTVTIETYLSDAWQEIRRPVGEPRDDVVMPEDEISRRRLEEIAKRRGKPQL